MTSDYDTKEMKNRCISCAYLCYLKSYKHTEIVDASRQAIMENSLAKSLYPEIRCYKRHHSERFSSFREANYEESRRFVLEAKCPKNDWQLHQDGITPEHAERRQTESKHYRWIKIAAVASIITIAVILILHFFPSCSFG
jgi:hypothetical protein